MFREYIASKVSRVRWIADDQSSCGDGFKWLCGTYGQYPNRVSVWSQSQSNDDANQMKSQTEVHVTGDVNQINVIEDNCVASLSSGQINLFAYSGDVLRLKYKWNSIDGFSANDSTVNPQTNEVIACGDNGVIRVLNLDSYTSEKRSKCLTQNSLKCIDLVSTKEVICGTSSGHLKLYDIRSGSVVLSMANELSIITCVKTNPNISHMISCGNDIGVLSLWDLRNSGQQLLQMSGHSALISELAYKHNEANIILTSSYDGSLFRWNISASSQLESVDAIMERDSGSPINSFDVNSFDEIIFSSDNEVLNLGHLWIKLIFTFNQLFNEIIVDLY